MNKTIDKTINNYKSLERVESVEVKMAKFGIKYVHIVLGKSQDKISNFKMTSRNDLINSLKLKIKIDENIFSGHFSQIKNHYCVYQNGKLRIRNN